MDEWSLELVASHPGLQGDDLQAKLEVCVALAAPSIADVEARHAALRRQLVGRNVETHALALTDLAAQWVLHQARVLRSRFPGVKKAIGKPFKDHDKIHN